MRCPDCNKFVSNDAESDPEVEEIEITEEPTAAVPPNAEEGSGAVDSHPGQVTARVRITVNCAECSTELKEHNFETEAELPEAVVDHVGEGHELSVEEESSERTERSEGKGRGTRQFYGYQLTAKVTCSCGKLGEDGAGEELVFEDDVQSSHMNELS